MSQLIHPTAIIHPSARLHSSVNVGAYSIVGPQVSIDEDTMIAPHVVVSGYTKIGKRNHIFQFASIGEVPQDLKFKGEETWLEIGDDNQIRESCTLHRGTVQDEFVTKIGSRNLLMVNTHIAHDCIVGNDNVIGNNAGIAGHVKIGDKIIIGGNCGVHQFCQIGSFSMLAGGSTLYKDVPAYVMAGGNPAEAHGMNFEGMRRRGWSSEKITLFKQAYFLIYKSGKVLKTSLQEFEQTLLPQDSDLQLFYQSILASTRGIVR